MCPSIIIREIGKSIKNSKKKKKRKNQHVDKLFKFAFC